MEGKRAAGCELLIVLSDCVSQQKREGKDEKKSDSACQVTALAVSENEEMTGGMRAIVRRVNLCHASTVHNNLLYECQNNKADVFVLATHLAHSEIISRTSVPNVFF